LTWFIPGRAPVKARCGVLLAVVQLSIEFVPLDDSFGGGCCGGGGAWFKTPSNMPYQL